MKSLWYLAQSAFIGWLPYAYWRDDPMASAGKLGVMIFLAICICAFMTACITRLWDYLRTDRHRGQTRADSLGLVRPRSGCGKPTEHRNRIGVGE